MRFRRMVWGGLFVMLAACSHTIDDMRFKLDPAGTATFSAKGSAELSDEDLAHPDQSDTMSSAQKFDKSVRDCGFDTTRYVKDRKIVIEARKVADIDTLAAKLKCVPTSLKDVSITMQRHDGLFFTNWQAHLKMGQKRFNIDAQGVASTASRSDFPLHLVLEVPGTIRSFADRSGVGGMKMTLTRESDQAVALTLSTSEAITAAGVKADQKVIDGLASGALRREEVAAMEEAVEIEVRSREPRWQVIGGLAIAGLLLVAGITAAWARGLFGSRAMRRAANA